MIWLPGPAQPPVPYDEVHVWRAWLDRDGWPEQDALPDGERDRGASIQIEDRRRRWVAARWALRLVLSRYTGGEPAELEIALEEGGKPRLAGGDGVRFNLSHSIGIALVAVTEGRDVGIDVEQVRDERPAGFYRDWARREAAVKCTGAGLRGAPTGEPIWVSDLEPGSDCAGAVALRGAEPASFQCFQLDPGI